MSYEPLIYGNRFRIAQFAFLSKNALQKLKDIIPDDKIPQLVQIIYSGNANANNNNKSIIDNIDYLNSSDLINRCFKELHKRGKGWCGNWCRYPAKHFAEGCCAPIGEVLKKLEQVIGSQIWQCFDDQDVLDVRNAIIATTQNNSANSMFESLLDEQNRQCIVYEMGFQQKKVIFFWPNDTMITDETCGSILPLWITLLHNLKQNFILTMPPTDTYTKLWQDYVTMQLEQADAVVVAPTTRLFNEYSPNRNYRNTRIPDDDDDDDDDGDDDDEDDEDGNENERDYNDYQADENGNQYDNADHNNYENQYAINHDHKSDFLVSFLKHNLNLRSNQNLNNSNNNNNDNNNNIDNQSSVGLSKQLPPVVLALAQTDTKNAYLWAPFIFHLPFQIVDLMATLYDLTIY